MRPKKRVLLIDADEDFCAETRFLLVTHGYAVQSISKPEDGSHFGCGAFDALLTRASVPVKAFNALAKQIESPTILLAEKAPLFMIFDRTLPETAPKSELIEIVRIATARKRGPRKGIARVPISVVAEAATA